MLTVRVANRDNVVGSALFSVQLFFASALNVAIPGAFSRTATTNLVGPVTSIGNTSNPWTFSGNGGSTELDLASFFNLFVEGPAVSPYRAAPGDPDNGTFVTNPGGFVEFSANLSSITGANGANSLTSIGFCTAASDINCATGVTAVPEPATLTLVATGVIGLAGMARRRRKSA
jgi:hypothetical protein